MDASTVIACVVAAVVSASVCFACGVCARVAGPDMCSDGDDDTRLLGADAPALDILDDDDPE